MDTNRRLFLASLAALPAALVRVPVPDYYVHSSRELLETLASFTAGAHVQYVDFGAGSLTILHGREMIVLVPDEAG